MLQDIKLPDTAGGYVYSNPEGSPSLANRTLYWRTIGDILELCEISLNFNLSGNKVDICSLKFCEKNEWNNADTLKKFELLNYWFKVKESGRIWIDDSNLNWRQEIQCPFKFIKFGPFFFKISQYPAEVLSNWFLEPFIRIIFVLGSLQVPGFSAPGWSFSSWKLGAGRHPRPYSYLRS